MRLQIRRSGRPCTRYPRSGHRRGLPARFARANNRVRRTDSEVDAREIEILRLLAAGKNLSEIASAIGVSYGTTASASAIIRRKLGLTTEGIIRFAIEQKLG